MAKTNFQCVFMTSGFCLFE